MSQPDPTATAAGITGATCGLCGKQIVPDYPARPDTYIHRDSGDEDCQPVTAATGFAGVEPAVPTARLRALVALLYPDHMTPIAKIQIERVIEEYE